MRKLLFLVAAIGVTATLFTPTAAVAQRRGDWYRDVRPYVSRRDEPTVRKARLVDETVRLRDDIRRADRRGDISSREADRLYNRVDRVARFLRDDRHLSGSEFDRRQNDLDGIARDLDRSLRSRTSSYDRRNDRYERDRYGRDR